MVLSDRARFQGRGLVKYINLMAKGFSDFFHSCNLS